MLTKGQLKSMMGQMDAMGVPDEAEVAVKVLSGEKMELDGNAFSTQGQDADVVLDAQNHWAPQVAEKNAVFLKQV